MQHAWGRRNYIQQFDRETETVRRTYGDTVYGKTLPVAKSAKRRMVEWTVDNQQEGLQSVNVTLVAQNTSDTSVAVTLYTPGGGTVSCITDSSACNHFCARY
jgi:hypothetical protein